MTTVFDLDRQLEYGRGLLIDGYEGVFSADEVDRAYDMAQEQLSKHAVIEEYLPVLVDRMTRQILTAYGQAQGRMTKELPEILFVSERNAGRSQMAAALTRELSGGRVNVRCAGVHPEGRLDPNAVTVLAERGITLDNPIPMPFSASLVAAADIVVTMNCSDFDAYPGKRWVDWDISDPEGVSLDDVRRICDKITRNVRTLLQDMDLLAEA